MPPSATQRPKWQEASIPLIVEDGSVVVGANSYIDVADADAYWADRGDTEWAALATPAKERAIIVAAQYIDNDAVWVYSGSRADADQFMSWPRNDATYWRSGPAIPALTVPLQMLTANCEAAKAASLNLLPTQAGPNGTVGAGVVQSEKVGDLSVSYFKPSDGGGAASKAGSGVLNYSNLALPLIAGILNPILDENWYTDAVAAGTGMVSRAQASRRGVVLVGGGAPLFRKGMNDNPYGPLQVPAPNPIDEGT